MYNYLDTNKNEDKKDISVYTYTWHTPLSTRIYNKIFTPKLNFSMKDRSDKKGKSHTLIVLKKKKRKKLDIIYFILISFPLFISYVTKI